MGGLAFFFLVQHTSAKPRSPVYNDFKILRIETQQQIFTIMHADALVKKQSSKHYKVMMLQNRAAQSFQHLHAKVNSLSGH